MAYWWSSTDSIGFFWSLFHHPYFFLVSSITSCDVDLLGLIWAFLSLGGLGDLWLIWSASSGVIDWHMLRVIYFSGSFSSLGELNGVVKLSVMAFSFSTGCVPPPLCRTISQWGCLGCSGLSHDLAWFVPSAATLISYDHWTGGVGWNSFQTMITFLFYWPL